MENPEPHLFADGRVFTGAGWSDSVLVDGGEVVAAGPRRSVERLRPTGTVRVPLGGRVLLPGLIDPHLHLSGIALRALGVDLHGSKRVGEVIERTRRWMGRHPRGPVVGRGWDDESFPDRRPPGRSDLDRIGGQRPIVLYRLCGHVASLNSAALEILGIDRRTPDAPGGRIGHHPDGEPDGLLFDSALDRLGEARALAMSSWTPSLRPLLRGLAAQGLTTIASLGASAEECRAVESLSRARPLACRVRFYLSHRALAGGPDQRPRFRSREVRVVGVKVFADGSFGARSAWLSAPYADAPNERGIPIARRSDLLPIAHGAARAGLQVAVHAMGDRAMAEVLRAYRDAPRLPRPRIEHAGLVPPALWPLLERVRPQLVVQPGFVRSDWWIVQRLGARRARWAYPFRSLARRGHRLAGSSDAPAEVTDPWVGLNAAVGRRRPLLSGHAPPPEQISATEAVRWYTQHAAEALGEPTLGHLGPGARADLVILNARSLPSALRLGARCVSETWREGRVVYRRRAAAR